MLEHGTPAVLVIEREVHVGESQLHQALLDLAFLGGSEARHELIAEEADGLAIDRDHQAIHVAEHIVE